MVGRHTPDKPSSLFDSDDRNRTVLRYPRRCCILRRDSFSESKTFDDSSKEVGRRLSHTASITTAPLNQIRPRKSQDPETVSAAGIGADWVGRNLAMFAEIAGNGAGEGRRPPAYVPRADTSAVGTA